MTLEPLVPLLVLWNKDLWYKKKFFHLIYIHSVIMMSLQKPMLSSYLIIVMGRIMSCSKYGFLETSLCWSIAVRIYRIKCPDGMVQDSVLPSLIISFQSSEIFFCDYRNKKSGITKHSNPDIFFQIQHRTDTIKLKKFFQFRPNTTFTYFKITSFLLQRPMHKSWEQRRKLSRVDPCFNSIVF